jgi:hypothetical protein
MSDIPTIPPAVQKLLDRGVVIPCPSAVEVDESVNPECIAPGVIVHTGSRISGATTSIGPGSELGREGPVALEDCQLGHNVELKGGFFSGATFLDGASMGSSSHVRPATLVEEEAGAAHAVGFKQTILLPFVTAGSLINFCDALMAGGTSRKNHSEIGSSYIHFNFTPHQDKATASLIGDVPRGVFLDQPAIFLGGQGGIVGPARIAYGTIVPAGSICRQDILNESTIFIPPFVSGKPRTFVAGVYRGINRIVENNLIYIGNLWALKAWYRDVRARTMDCDPFRHACRIGAIERIEDGLKERIKRLKELAEKMPFSLERAGSSPGQDLPAGVQAQQRALIDRWPKIESQLLAGPPSQNASTSRGTFLQALEEVDVSQGHVNAVKALSKSAREAGEDWLQGIVNWAASLWAAVQAGE